VPSSTLQGTERELGGVLLQDKPAGVTSHDVVASIRRSERRKVGHAGTLDPFATGLLVVMLGRATRLQRYLVGLPKTYVATARLGWRSSTGDPDGVLERTGRIPSELGLPTGPLDQRPPMTSAVKMGGERLYRKARRGEVVDRPTRRVHVYRAELLDRSAEQATFEIECSSGTYVRVLIETLPDAYCETLRRTRVGPFSLDEAGRELSVERALEFLPECRLDEAEAETAAHGVAVRRSASDEAMPPLGGAPGMDRPADADQMGERSAVRLTYGGRLIAVARPQGDLLKPEVVLA